MAVDVTKTLGAVTYQGIPCRSGSFSVTPGMTPDVGFVTILVRNPEAMRLVTFRPMFSRGRMTDQPRASFSRYKDTGMLDGSSLVLNSFGALVCDSQAGRVVYNNVWIADEGVAEEQSMLDVDGTTRIAVIRITISDERMWWGRRGYVFGSFNKTGVDGKHLKATGKDDAGTPFSLPDLLEMGLQNTGPQNPLGELKVDLPLEDFTPKDKEPRFSGPVDFLQDVVEELRLMPCKQVDGVVDFCSPGVGADPTEEIIPREYIIHDLVTRGHDYSPDTILLYAQHPTVEEVEIQFSGQESMVLPDPRDGEFRPAYEMLKYYNILPAVFESIPCLVKTGRQISEVARGLRGYVQGLPVGKPAAAGGDFIPSVFNRQPKDLRKREALRRANLLVQYAFKAFQLPKAKMHLLPFEETLLSTDKKDPADTGLGEPRPIICRVQSYTNRSEREAASVDNPWGGRKMYWVNWGEPVELLSGQGGFRLEGRTGLLIFTQTVGKLYRRMSDGSVVEIPDETPTTNPGNSGVDGQPFDVFSLRPPTSIYLHVAHQLRGTRDLRSAPGTRTKFPSQVAEIQLQERASPEDHFQIGYDRNGREILRLDEIDETYPEVHQMVGARKMRTVNSPANTAADEEISEQAERIVRPLFAKTDGNTSRRIKGYGIYTPKIDGVVTQVRWDVSEEGVATTEILVGSLRRKLGPGMMSFAEKMPRSEIRGGDSSGTNLSFRG